MANELTSAQRIAYFNKYTKKYMKPLTQKSVTESGSLSWELPRARYLSKIFVHLTGTYDLTHASETSIDTYGFGIYNFIKRLKLNLNNGFMPIDCSAFGLYTFMNISKRGTTPVGTFGTTASSGGTTNTVDVWVEVPIVLNERDPIGLLPLQNSEAYITFEMEFGALSDVFSTSSLTVDEVSLKAEITLETFSAPSDKNYQPDTSVIKMIHERLVPIQSATFREVMKSGGPTYRRILIYCASSNTTLEPIANSNVDKLSMIFKRSDVPYEVSGSWLRWMNEYEYGEALDTGMYVLDFASQGVPNLGNLRDVIDTELITDFEIAIDFDSSISSGHVYMITEELARLA